MGEPAEAWPLVDRRGGEAVRSDCGGLLGGKDFLELGLLARPRQCSQGKPLERAKASDCFTGHNMEFLLPGHKSPSLTPIKRKQGNKPGPNTSAVTGHTPRRRGGWIPGSLAPGSKLGAWISIDPIANFPQVPRPLLRCWPLSPAPRTRDHCWNPAAQPYQLPTGPQTLLIPLVLEPQAPQAHQLPPGPHHSTRF